MSERVAFLGLGIMGSRMAANLARAGFELTVWNRTAVDGGASSPPSTARRVAATPAEAADAAPTSCSRWSSTAPRCEQVLLGDDGAARTARAAGTLFVDCSTIGPAATLRDRRSAGRARRSR